MTVVGAGIAGLYAAYLLRLAGFTTEVLEQNDERCGGRIATRRYPAQGQGKPLLAEFGPMRFELDLQWRFRTLCEHLGVDLDPFTQTMSPRVTTEYEMTDVEKEFSTVALHQWAVLRMFFAREPRVKRALRKIDDEGSKPQVAGARQLHWLRCYMDRRLFVEEKGGKLRKRSEESIEGNLTSLRKDQRLFGDDAYPRLRELGLWQALSEVISPGAISKIRDSGTFYHFIADNPSAVEWGIFWLRQASVLGTLFTIGASTGSEAGMTANYDGVSTVIDKLVDKLGEQKVPLRLGREVRSVEPAKRPGEVVLRVAERNPRGRAKTSNLLADHVILALPQLALRRLNRHFPDDVNECIEGVAAIPLLKAFVVTRQPWWRDLAAQSYAWRLPTRELHFQYQKETGLGMIMLYTDEPAIAYWQSLIPAQQRRKLLWRSSDSGRRFDAAREVDQQRFGLLAFLIRRLLVLPHPGLPGMIDSVEPGFRRQLDPKHRRLLRQKDSSLLGLSQQIVELIDDRPSSKLAIERALKGALTKAGRGRGPLIKELPDNWLSALETALRHRRHGVIPPRDVRQAAGHVEAYGIRDWSAEPFGGACHVWRPGFSALDAGRLVSFSLRERGGAQDISNVHICGEAYSGDQGFIEGALSTAEAAVVEIANRYGKPPPTLQSKSPGPDPSRWPKETRAHWKKLAAWKP